MSTAAPKGSPLLSAPGPAHFRGAALLDTYPRPSTPLYSMYTDESVAQLPARSLSTTIVLPYYVIVHVSII